MKQRLVALGALLVAMAVVMALAGCQKALPGPVSTAAESPGRALTAQAWEETPVPGSTVVSAVTSIPGPGTVEVVITEVVLPTQVSGATPIPTPGTTQSTTEPISTTPAGTQSIVHTVQAGETLLTIAAKYDVSVQDILRANNLQDADLIYVGQRLTIPKAGAATAQPGTGGCRYYHTVKSGDRVWQLARDYNADPYAILRANGLTIQNAVIYPGQKLCIP